MLFLPYGAIPKFSRSGSMTWWNVCSTARLFSLNSRIGLGIGTKKHANSLLCYHGYCGNEETRFSLYYVVVCSIKSKKLHPWNLWWTILWYSEEEHHFLIFMYRILFYAQIILRWICICLREQPFCANQKEWNHTMGCFVYSNYA